MILPEIMNTYINTVRMLHVYIPLPLHFSLSEPFHNSVLHLHEHVHANFYACVLLLLEMYWGHSRRYSLLYMCTDSWGSFGVHWELTHTKLEFSNAETANSNFSLSYNTLLFHSLLFHPSTYMYIHVHKVRMINPTSLFLSLNLNFSLLIFTACLHNL